MFQLSHLHMTTGKTITLTRCTFVSKECLCFLICGLGLSIALYSRSTCLNFMAAVTVCSDFGAPQNKVYYCFHCFPIYFYEVMGPDAMIVVFWMLSFKPTFSLSSFTYIKRLFSSSSLSAIRVVSSAYLRLLKFLLAILIPLVLHPAQHFSWCTLHIS